VDRWKSNVRIVVTVVRKCYPTQIVVGIEFKYKFEYLDIYIVCVCDYPFDNFDSVTGGLWTIIFFLLLLS